MAAGHDDDPTDGPGSVPSGFEGFALGIAGLGKRMSPGWQDGAEPPAGQGPGNPAAPERTLPGLQDEERLPWLHASEDERDDAGIDAGRVWGVVLTALALLVLAVGGLWFSMHRSNAGAQLADGSLIAAPLGPIKLAPQDPGGKTFDGTGDSSFTVSQGHAPGATLASVGEGADGEAGAVRTVAEPAAATAVATKPGGIGVQVGAFSTQLAAEAAWEHLVKAYDALSGVSHRIVEGKADIGTVYRLQAVAGSDDAATALCDRLKTAGLNCQVKD